MRIYGHNRGLRQLADRLRDVDVSLRWGGQQVPGAINGSVHLLNGLEQLRTLYKAGILVPDFTEDIRIAHQWGDRLVLGRKLEHTQGKDICLSSSPYWRTRDFWVRYQRATREWRFHILRGSSIARGLKNWVGMGPEPTQPPIVRSRRLGWHMVHNIEPPKGAREIARKAVEAVKYDLGAVDLLEIGDGRFMVLEVNSRPAIRDEYTTAAYVRALREAR